MIGVVNCPVPPNEMTEEAELGTVDVPAGDRPGVMGHNNGSMPEVRVAAVEVVTLLASSGPIDVSG